MIFRLNDSDKLTKRIGITFHFFFNFKKCNSFNAIAVYIVDKSRYARTINDICFVLFIFRYTGKNVVNERKIVKTTAEI